VGNKITWGLWRSGNVTPAVRGIMLRKLNLMSKWGIMLLTSRNASWLWSYDMTLEGLCKSNRYHTTESLWLVQENITATWLFTNYVNSVVIGIYIFTTLCSLWGMRWGWRNNWESSMISCKPTLYISQLSISHWWLIVNLLLRYVEILYFVLKYSMFSGTYSRK
jgi:hypothetical protein